MPSTARTSRQCRFTRLRAAARMPPSRSATRKTFVSPATSTTPGTRTPAYAAPVRILLVSQMYPGPDAPDLGTFVAQVERALVERGHEVQRAVLDTRAGGKLRYLELARRTLRARRAD